MKDVMIDIETLGVRSDAMIIQIGACYFDRDTGEIGTGFSVNIDSSAFPDKFSVDYSTAKWWFEQSANARILVMENPMALVPAVHALFNFLTEHHHSLWSHSTFDIPILVHAFEVVGLKFPVHYRDMRDIRTLMDIANHRSDTDRAGVHHNAFDDCKYQVKYCVEALQKLNEKK